MRNFSFDRIHEAREHLIYASRQLKIYERQNEDPAHAWALVKAARACASHAVRVLDNDWERES